MTDADLKNALESPIPEVVAFARSIESRKQDRRFGLWFTIGSILLIVVTGALSLFGKLASQIPFIVMIAMVIASFVVPLMRKPPAPPDLVSIERLLQDDCDPYRYARAYNDLLPMFERPSDQVICRLSIAHGLFLQGAYETMESFLQTLNPYSIPELTLQSLYDIQARYFLHRHDEQAVSIVEGNLKGFSSSYPHQTIVALCNQTLCLIEAYRLARQGDAEAAYKRLEERNSSITQLGGGTTRFQLVDYHYNRAVVGEMASDYASMVTDCLYVIENGGLLAYVQEASDMLDRH